MANEVEKGPKKLEMGQWSYENFNGLMKLKMGQWSLKKFEILTTNKISKFEHIKKCGK